MFLYGQGLATAGAISYGALGLAGRRVFWGKD